MVARARRSPPPPPSTPGSPGRITLPRLVTDPVWSLRPWPVHLELAGMEFEIPAMVAADWLAILMDPDLRIDSIFPGLLVDADQAEVEVALHGGGLDLEEYVNLGFEILSEVTGRPWWVALRLIGVARGSWDAIGGEIVRKADAERLSISGWLDVLYPVIIEGLEDSKRSMFLLKLELAPEGWGEEEADSMEMSTDAFLAMA